MKVISTLKIAPLAGVLALGIALSPVAVMADNAERGRDKGQYSHEKGKSFNKGSHGKKTDVHKKVQPQRHLGDAHNARGFNGRSRKQVITNYYVKPHGKHKNKVIYRYEHDGHHGHPYYRHEHHHVVYDHYHVYDDIRFKIGVHTGNFDIVFQD